MKNKQNTKVTFVYVKDHMAGILPPNLRIGTVISSTKTAHKVAFKGISTTITLNKNDVEYAGSQE